MHMALWQVTGESWAMFVKHATIVLAQNLGTTNICAAIVQLEQHVTLEKISTLSYSPPNHQMYPLLCCALDIHEHAQVRRPRFAA